MSVEGAVNALLKADAGVAALVGARVYAVAAPQAPSYPLLVTAKSGGGAPLRTLGGGTVIHDAEFEVVAEAKTAAEADAVVRAVQALFNRHSGTTDGTAVLATRLLSDPEDGYDPELKLYQKSVTVGIRHT